MKPSPVNWLPWSVLNTSGLPLPSASSKASTQNSASRVLDRFQATTYRVYQSILPRKELGLVISMPPSRYGYTLCPGPGWLVRGRRKMAWSPMVRIRRRTRFRFAE